jgi:hypothetical protein
MHIISSTFIYRPIKQVFEFISIPENDFQWQYTTLASTRLSGGVGLGTCFQSVSNFMENRIQSTYEVNEYEPTIDTGSSQLLDHYNHSPCLFSKS